MTERMENALRHIKTSVDVDPWAVEEVERVFKAYEQPQDGDLISRDSLLEKMADYVVSGYADSAEDFEEYSKIVCSMPSVSQNLVNDSQGLVKGDRAVSLNAMLEYLKANVDDFPDYHEAIEFALQLPSIDLSKWAEEHGYVIIDKDVWKDAEIAFGKELDEIIKGMNGGDTE